MTTPHKTLVAVATLATSVLAVGAVAAATNATTAGGGSTVKRTVACKVDSDLEVSANAKRPDIGAAAYVYSNGSVVLVGFDTTHKGSVLDSSACHSAKVKIPLTHARLPLAGTYAAGDYTSFQGRCLFSGPVFVRMLLHLDSSQTPTNAKLAVWRRVKAKHSKRRILKPLAFVQWSPAHTRAYLAPACGG